MSRPLIHVLIPTYEPNPVFLRETLDSLLAQTEQRWICLINDDASTVDVHSIVDPYLQDARFTFRKNQKRLGIGGNWNACLGVAFHAEPGLSFIQFLFQDDTWHPTYLARSLQILQQHPDVGFVASGHRYVCEKTLETAHGYECLYQQKKKWPKGKQHGSDFLDWWMPRGLCPNIIGEPSFVMLRRTFVEEVGYFCTELKQLLDAEYWVRLLQKKNWYYLADDLGMFRVHDQGASYRHFLADEGMVEHLVLLDRLQCTLPSIHLDQHIADIICHIINRMIRGRSIGKGARPTILFLRSHPKAAFRGLRRYLRQACGRWWKKIYQACRIASCEQRSDPQYSVDRIAAFSFSSPTRRSLRPTKKDVSSVCGGRVHRARLPV